MTSSIFGAMTLTACLTVWSPGPNNILLLSTASKYGFQKNLKFMCGIWTGSLFLMCCCGIFCNGLNQILPNIQIFMKYIGAGYIFYLAYKTLRRLPPGESSSDREPSYTLGIFLQIINVKLIIYGITMFSSFILPYESRFYYLFFYALYLMVLGAIGNLLWAFAGNLLKSLYVRYYKIMNLCMALLLCWCSLRILGILN